MNNKWKAHLIRQELSDSKKFVKKSLKVLYEEQVRKEKELEQTIYFNRVGFNKNDGKILSQLATKRNWSKEDYKVVRTRLYKYAVQIYNLTK